MPSHILKYSIKLLQFSIQLRAYHQTYKIKMSMEPRGVNYPSCLLPRISRFNGGPAYMHSIHSTSLPADTNDRRTLTQLPAQERSSSLSILFFFFFKSKRMVLCSCRNGKLIDPRTVWRAPVLLYSVATNRRRFSGLMNGPGWENTRRCWFDESETTDNSWILHLSEHLRQLFWI